MNFMRRDTFNEGCQQDMTLGVTYSGTYSIRDVRLPEDYHFPRQTITVGSQQNQIKVDIY